MQMIFIDPGMYVGKMDIIF